MIYELDLLAEYVCQLNSANHGHYAESASSSSHVRAIGSNHVYFTYNHL